MMRSFVTCTYALSHLIDYEMDHRSDAADLRVFLHDIDGSEWLGSFCDHRHGTESSV